MNAKAQTIFLSLFIFLGLFILFAAQFLQQIYFDKGAGERKQEELYAEAQLISAQLITQGAPPNWETLAEPQKIGLMTQQRLDPDKWDALATIIQTETCDDTSACYLGSKELFGIENDYAIRIRAQQEGAADYPALSRNDFETDLEDASIVQSFSRIILDQQNKSALLTVFVYE
jgi:hypothetical protein